LNVRFNASNKHQRFHFGKKELFLPVIGKSEGSSGALRSNNRYQSRSVENTLSDGFIGAPVSSRASGSW